MRRLRLAHSAERELTAIWTYTLSEWGEKRANNYLAALEQAFSQLLENPSMGKARPDIARCYRALTVKKHCIFYCIATESVDVLRILHGRMDAWTHGR